MTNETPTISQQTRALQTGSAATLPADVINAFADHQALLDAQGVPPNILRAGALMPDGNLLDVHGVSTSLTRLRAGKPAVVVFYRGAWCPYCNIALRSYQVDLVPALAERGFELIAVSPQRPDGSLTSAESNELTFSVASDPGNQIASVIGILSEPSPDSVAAQMKLGLDLAEVNADGGRTLPMPTVVVVDRAGIIRWIDVHPNYTSRSEVADILAAVDTVV